MDADFALTANPIPGMSLTSEPGNSPWEQPPMFVELADVVDYYSDKLTTPEAFDGITEALSNEATVTDLTNVMIKAAVMKGVHTIDVGLVAFPIIAEIIKTVGDIAGVGYVMSTEDYNKSTRVSEKMLKDIIKETKASVKEKIETDEPKGLMARGAK